MPTINNPAQTELDLEDIKFINIKQVVELTGASKSFIYALIKDKKFPAPVKYGKSISRWVEHEVRDWMRQQMLARSA